MRQHIIERRLLQPDGEDAISRVTFAAVGGLANSGGQPMGAVECRRERPRC